MAKGFLSFCNGYTGKNFYLRVFFVSRTILWSYANRSGDECTPNCLWWCPQKILRASHPAASNRSFTSQHAAILCRENQPDDSRTHHSVRNLPRLKAFKSFLCKVFRVEKSVLITPVGYFLAQIIKFAMCEEKKKIHLHEQLLDFKVRLNSEHQIK